ncbi:uncharacterized protein LOC110842455 isoform X2 [Folsomia candida]|uniref:uncharacterized protein LOC110842455 isoform X2 n=1 Tax=Folsomia candida TaxID=158441 RepID=UPI001604D792|nr:uncharacterized protein LOC110842455 isoform X2 [Folsomia candida]
MSRAHRRQKVAYSTPLTPFETPSEWGFTRPVSTISGGSDKSEDTRTSSSQAPSSIYGRNQHKFVLSSRSSTSSSRYVTAPAPSSSSSSSRRRGNYRREPAPVEDLFDKYDNDPSFTGGVVKCHEFVQTHFGKKYPRQIQVGNLLQKREEIRARFFGDGQPVSDRNRVVLDPFSYMTPPRIGRHSPAPSSGSGCSFL